MPDELPTYGHEFEIPIHHRQSVVEVSGVVPDDDTLKTGEIAALADQASVGGSSLFRGRWVFSKGEVCQIANVTSVDHLILKLQGIIFLRERSYKEFREEHLTSDIKIIHALKIASINLVINELSFLKSLAKASPRKWARREDIDAVTLQKMILSANPTEDLNGLEMLDERSLEPGESSKELNIDLKRLAITLLRKEAVAALYELNEKRAVRADAYQSNRKFFLAKRAERSAA